MAIAPADPRLNRARAVARALDTAITIPGTGIRFGLDPILGVLPGVGDLVGAALSGYIVLTGIRLGAPPVAVVRMIINIAIDTFVGSVPLVGDLFDAGWKSNVRNIAIIEQHVEPTVSVRAVNRTAIIAGVILLVLVAVGGIGLTVIVIRMLLGLLHRP